MDNKTKKELEEKEQKTVLFQQFKASKELNDELDVIKDHIKEKGQECLQSLINTVKNFKTKKKNDQNPERRDSH